MIQKEVLEDIAADWANEIEKETIVERELATALEATIKQEEISVIKGVRRAGKTFMLYYLMKKNGGTYINFEDERLRDFDLDDFEKLLDIAQKNEPILYLDEVQHILGWEKFAHRAHRKIKIFVTGSNSKLLSSDYAKSLVGRTKSFDVYPLSFTEYLKFTEKKRSRQTLIKYMETGGFPRIVMTGDTSLAKEYLDRIIYKDILGTENIKHPEAIKTLAYYLLSNVGKEFSFRSLKSITGLKHESTIRDYLGHLKNAYLIDIVKKYDSSIKAQETYGKKIYAIDPSFISLGIRKERDSGRVLENAVYLHLNRTKYDIFYGKNSKEVDFIVCEGLEPLKIINVTFEAESEKTLKREVGSLHYFQDKYKIPGELVSLYPCKVPESISSHLAHKYI